MSKSLAASNKLMKNYLSELLTEEQVEQPIQVAVKEKTAQPIEKLLNKVSVAEVVTEEKQELLSTAKAENKVITKPIEQAPIKPSVKPIETKVLTPKIAPKKQIKQATTVKLKDELKTRKSEGIPPQSDRRSYREGNFQAMFFEVAGLVIAVPLIELGGIHNSEKTTSLIGKPDWFTGVMLQREEKINVVNTALWVMPEKCDESLLSSLNYQYVIMLNNSKWGLSAEKLVDTVTLNQDDVKWLDSSNKRPWLAGLVKDRMCALLDVDALILLLEKGANITQE